MAVVGVHLAVEDGRADEDETAGGYDGAAVALGAGVAPAAGDEVRVFAEGNLPEIFSGVEVDCVERAPGWSDGWVAVGADESAVAGEAEARLL